MGLSDFLMKSNFTKSGSYNLLCVKSKTRNNGIRRRYTVPQSRLFREKTLLGSADYSTQTETYCTLSKHHQNEVKMLRN